MKVSKNLLSNLCRLVVVPADPRTRADELYVGLGHIRSGRLVRTGEGRASDVRSSKSHFKPGDVLYGKLRPYLDKAVLVDEAGICTTELLVLRAKMGVDPKFLVGVLHSPIFIEYAVSGVTGVQHPRTSWAHISRFVLPEFTLEEQTQIGEFLWLVHETIEKSEQLIDEGRALKSTVMHNLFTRGLRGEAQEETEIGPLPVSWNVGVVKNHFTVVSGGTPSRRKPEFWTGGSIPWVKTTEIDYRVIQKTEEHITQAGLDRSSAKLLPAGTLLLAMYGQGVTRGKVAILGIDAACNQACAAVNAQKDGLVSTEFLYHFLTFRYEAIRRLAHGGQQQNLNLAIVRDLKIGYPTDAKEQREIIAILDAIDQKIHLHLRKRELLAELFTVLLDKQMTGEIRVGDLKLTESESRSPYITQKSE